MIVGERKPFDEIKESINKYKKALILGCGTCVSVCMAGGEKEVEILASQLRMASKSAGQDIETSEATIQRQCDREYVEPIIEKAKEHEVIVSMACGAGVQTLAEVFSNKIIIPANDTKFIGMQDRESGKFHELCRACGECLLFETAGICPITRCAKGLLNGPCGGSINGKCEIDKELDCIWDIIYQKLKKRGDLDRLKKIKEPKDWSKSTLSRRII